MWMRKILALSILLVLLVYQGCSDGLQNPLRFESSTNKYQSSEVAGGGNGEGYDGKIRILHHYVDNFTCNGKPAPESVLFRNSEMNWYLIQNSKQSCPSNAAIAVEGVVYDEGTKTATYNGKIYVPPRPYFVDTNANPNLPDVNLMDGICADENGTCSLRAAVQQTVPVSFTDAVIIHIPAGIFNLTSPLSLRGVMPDSHEITIRGESPTTSILDGGGATRHFSIRSTSMAPITIENLTLQNGFYGNTLDPGASISYQLDPSAEFRLKSADGLLQEIRNFFPEYDEATANPLNSRLNITNCVFKGNKNHSTIIAGHLTGKLTVRNSLFIQNEQHGVYSTSADSLVVEDSIFVEQASRGIAVHDNISQVSIRRSRFSETYEGVSLIDCRNCSLESIESFNNKRNGLTIITSLKGSIYDVIIRDAKIYDNLTGPGSLSTPNLSGSDGNIHVQFNSPTNYLDLIDSNLFMTNSALPNCSSNATINQIRLRNTMVNDASCQP